LEVVRVGVHVCSCPQGDHQTHAPPPGRFLPDMLMAMTKSEGKAEKRWKERKYNVSHPHSECSGLRLPDFDGSSITPTSKEFWKE
jgi:hypothetical protein